MFEPFWRPTQQKPPTLTDQMVAEAEATLNFKFPAAYLALLRTQNGGYIHQKRFPITSSASVNKEKNTNKCYFWDSNWKFLRYIEKSVSPS